MPSSTDLLVPIQDFNFRLSWDGGALATFSDRELLLPYLQAPPLPNPPAESHVDQLKPQYLQPNLDIQLGDVSYCGHVLFSHNSNPNLLPEVSLPTSLVEPTLPTFGPQAAQGTNCGWQERDVATHILTSSNGDNNSTGTVAPLDSSLLLQHRRLMSRHAAREEGWRGFSVSTPYLPGAADDLVSAAAAASVADSSKPAVQEAQSGLWLAQLESGMLPQVCAPGLSSGAFGGWQSDAQQVQQQQQGLQQQLAAGGGQQPVGAGPAAAAPPQAARTGMQPAGASAATGGANPLLLPTSFKVAQAAALRGVFDDVWMLGTDDRLIEEEEEGEEEEQQPAQETQAATPAALELPPLTAAVAAEPAGKDSVDDILAAAELLASGRTVAGQAAAAAAAAANATGATRRPVLGVASAGSNTEWAVRGGVSDLTASWEAIKPRLAAKYPFELDTFQKEAIIHLERGESVFVAAHTSAGKTVVAEYAFALAAQHCTRAIYTSPIKTISNQKYRDLSAKFDVGLLTGDVQLSPTSPCLIMTTEILRSMLYRGADLIRDVEWVVFDEVHYVNDADRGVVWEEVIIMLPPHIGIVMLSATVPNQMDFADWVGRIKRKVIYVSGTSRRPVPLEHSLYYSGELYPVCNKETFNPDGVRQAHKVHKAKNEVADPRLKSAGAGGRGPGGQQQGPGPRGQAAGGGRGQAAGGGRGGQQGARGGGGAGRAQQVAQGAMRAYGGGSGPNASSGLAGERQQLLELIQLLKKKSMLPVAVFCFSKKRCDASTSALGSLDLTTSSEKHTAHVFLEKVLARLNEQDRALPQILRLRELIRRGLGVHHAGLLPVMKEAVEMLFCQGYIKVLFCTETFAMGVNAPTRTVVFHSLRKHDGKEFRYLLPGEYTQMAGRAGRRGLDPLGHVIIACWEDIPEEGVLRTLLTGRGVSLGSQFRLTYSMITNMMRVEDLKVEDMLKRSFAEWQAQRSAPQAAAALTQVQTLLTQLKAAPWPACTAGCSREEVEEYYMLGERISELTAKIQEAMLGTRQAQAALTQGRFLLWRNPINGLIEPAILLGDTPDSCRMMPKSSSSSSPGLVSKSTAGASGTGLSKRVVLLVLHSPGHVDARHLTDLNKKREKSPSTQTTPRQTGWDDSFAGMRMIGGGKRGGDTGSPAGSGPGPLPRYGQQAGLHYMLADAEMSEVMDIGRGKVKVEPADLLQGDWGMGPDGSSQGAAGGDAGLSAKVKQVLNDALRALHKEVSSNNGNLPVLDARSDLKLNDLDLAGVVEERSTLQQLHASQRPAHCMERSEQFNLVRAAVQLQRKEEQLQHELSDASLLALPEFEARVRVLQRLGYLDEDRAVTLKGRVLCEINSSQDELISSELVLSGVLEGLSPAEAVALVSALVFQEKSEVEPELPPALGLAKQQLQQLALATATAAAEEGVPIDPQEAVQAALHPGLMQVVYEWALGTPFRDICELTDVMEGSIVRAVVRLDQMCRELQDAARVMGNTTLFIQMQAASAAIKRDVVFAASLYIA